MERHLRSILRLVANNNMRQIVYLVLIFVLFSCDLSKGKEIATLFDKVTANRISGNKSDAIKDCEKIISIDNSNIDAYRILSELTFEVGNFEESLKLNKKLIELDPESYKYYSNTAFLLMLFDKKAESEVYYEKARKVFSKKEQEYWSKTDTLSMATMLMTIGDSVRSKTLLKSYIERRPNDSIYRKVLQEFNNYNHWEMVNQLRNYMK